VFLPYGMSILPYSVIIALALMSVLNNSMDVRHWMQDLASHNFLDIYGMSFSP
jgi:hypothetical protein